MPDGFDPGQFQRADQPFDATQFKRANPTSPPPQQKSKSRFTPAQLAILSGKQPGPDYSEQKLVRERTTMRPARLSDRNARPIDAADLPPDRHLSYDPEDPLGYARALGKQPGFANTLHGLAAEFADPRMLAATALLGPATTLGKAALVSRAGMAARPALRAIPRVLQAGIGAAGLVQGGPNAVNAIESGDYGKAAAESIMPLLAAAALTHAVRPRLPLGASVAERIAAHEENPNAAVQTEPIEEPAEVAFRPGSTGKTGKGRGVGKGASEPVQQPAGARQEPAETSPGEPAATAKQAAPEPEAKASDVTSARKAMMARDREQLGLNELPPPQRKAWQTTLDNAKSKNLHDQAQAVALSDSVLKNPRSLNDEETAGIVLRAQAIKNQHADLLGQVTAETDPAKIDVHRQAMKLLEDEFETHSNALKQSGTEKGRTLAAQKLTINQDYDLISVKARAKAEKGADLSPKRQAQYESVVAERDVLQKKLDAVQLNRAVRQRATPGTPEFGSNNKLFTRERADAAQARLKEKLGGRLSAGVDPTILKDVVEIGGYYVEGGVRSFSTWAKQMQSDHPALDDEHLQAAWTELTNDKRLAAAKKRMQASLTATEQSIASGGKPGIKPPKVEYDAEYLNLKKQRDALNYKLETMIAAEHKPHPLDYINAVQRFAILSGFQSAEKIGIASAERVGMDTAESMFGNVLAKVPGMKQVAARSPGEGGGPITADVKAFVHAWSAPDMVKKGWTGTSSVDQAYFERTGKAPDIHSGNRVMQLLELPGQIHAAIKLPAQRAAWERGLARRGAWEVKNGGNLEDPATQIRVAEGAYADSLNAIFRGDNILSRQWRNAMSGLETTAKTSKNKGVAAGAKLFQVAAKLEVPIVRIPTNLAIESTHYSPYGLVRAAYEVIASKGVKNLRPEQADIVMRATKKGLIGSAVMAAVWMNPDKVQVSEKEGDIDGLHKGDMKVFGLRIPNVATHHPALMAIKTAAAGRKAYDESEETGAARGVEAVAHGAVTTAREIPFVSNLQSLSRAFSSGKAAVKHAKDLGRSFIPREAQNYLIPKDK